LYKYLTLTQINYKPSLGRSDFMARFTGGLIGGVTIGLLIGAGLTVSTTDPKARRKMMREGRRAMLFQRHV
jgi:hypothetical protein